MPIAESVRGRAHDICNLLHMAGVLRRRAGIPERGQAATSWEGWAAPRCGGFGRRRDDTGTRLIATSSRQGSRVSRQVSCATHWLPQPRGQRRSGHWASWAWVVYGGVRDAGTARGTFNMSLGKQSTWPGSWRSSMFPNPAAREPPRAILADIGRNRCLGDPTSDGALHQGGGHGRPRDRLRNGIPDTRALAEAA